MLPPGSRSQTHQLPLLSLCRAPPFPHLAPISSSIVTEFEVLALELLALAQKHQGRARQRT